MGHLELQNDWCQNYLMHAPPKSSGHFIERLGGTWMHIGTYYCAYERMCYLTESKSCRKGLNQKQVEYAVKKYRSHRKVGAGIMMDVNIINMPS